MTINHILMILEAQKLWFVSMSGLAHIGGTWDPLWTGHKDTCKQLICWNLEEEEEEVTLFGLNSMDYHSKLHIAKTF